MQPDFLNRSQPQHHFKNRVIKISWQFDNSVFLVWRPSIVHVRIRIPMMIWPPSCSLGKNLASAPVTWFSRNLPSDLTNRGIWSDLASDIIETPHLWIKKSHLLCFFFPDERNLSVARRHKVSGKKAWWSMKHHRVFAIIWVLCACLWNWFPLFVRLAISRMPSSGKIVSTLRLSKNFGKRFDGPADSRWLASVSNTGSIKRCHHIPLDEPDSLDHQTGLFAGSNPSWDNTSTLELGRTKGHFCKTINSAYPPFVPPITFPPIRLRHCSYRSPRRLLSSKLIIPPILNNICLTPSRPWIGITAMDSRRMHRVPAVSIKVSKLKDMTSVLPSLVQRMAITRSTVTYTNLKLILKARSLFIPLWKFFDSFPLEEANAALTSQTLNADGTPKRPMNAFMIFARRRRPQVSSENQAMRTGEISKLLSKEWVSMPSVNT